MELSERSIKDISEFMKKEPYNPAIGDIGAYVRHIRYSCKGMYYAKSSMIKPIVMKILGENSQESHTL